MPLSFKYSNHLIKATLFPAVLLPAKQALNDSHTNKIYVLISVTLTIPLDENLFSFSVDRDSVAQYSSLTVDDIKAQCISQPECVGIDHAAEDKHSQGEMYERKKERAAVNHRRVLLMKQIYDRNLPLADKSMIRTNETVLESSVCDI